MGMDHYEKAIEILERSEENLLEKKPCDESAVRYVEQKLSVVFPPTFRRFLLELGQAEIGNFDILGVDSIDPAKSPLLLEALNSSYPETLLTIIDSDELGDRICLDFSNKDLIEKPVVRSINGERVEQVATDFGDYLLHLLSYYQDKEVTQSPPELPVFNPPYGYEKKGNVQSPCRKEIKIAGTIVHLRKYEGASWNAILQQLNSRKIRMRGGIPWTLEALLEVYNQWDKKY